MTRIAILAIFWKIQQELQADSLFNWFLGGDHPKYMLLVHHPWWLKRSEELVVRSSTTKGRDLELQFRSAFLVSKYIGSQGLCWLLKPWKIMESASSNPFRQKERHKIQQFFLVELLGHVWNLGLRFMFEWKQLSATKLGDDGPFVGGGFGPIFSGVMLVLLFVGRFRNPKANHGLDVFETLVNNGIIYHINWWVYRISEPSTVGRFGESRCFFVVGGGGGDVRDLLVLGTMKYESPHDAKKTQKLNQPVI